MNNSTESSISQRPISAAETEGKYSDTLVLSHNLAQEVLDQMLIDINGRTETIDQIEYLSEQSTDIFIRPNQDYEHSETTKSFSSTNSYSSNTRSTPSDSTSTSHFSHSSGIKSSKSDHSQNSYSVESLQVIIYY